MNPHIVVKSLEFQFKISNQIYFYSIIL